MEELGLGTKSTRHEVIGKLISRRYVEGTPPVRPPTLVGRGVVEAMENHGVPITNPEMTSTIEQHMEEIKEANLSRDEVISESKTMLRRVFDALEANEEQIGREIMDRNDEERIIGKCPVCEHDLMIRQTRGVCLSSSDARATPSVHLTSAFPVPHGVRPFVKIRPVNHTV